MAKLNEEELKILKAMAEIGGPAGSKDVAEKTGIPKDKVSKAITKLKKMDYVMSPKRCYYAPAEKAKEVL